MICFCSSNKMIRTRLHSAYECHLPSLSIWVPPAITLHMSAICHHSTYVCHLPSLCIWVSPAITLHMSATCHHSAYECHLPSLCIWVPPAITHRFTIISPAKHHDHQTKVIAACHTGQITAFWMQFGISFNTYFLLMLMYCVYYFYLH